MINRKKFLGASAINGAGFIVVSLLNVLWYFLIIRSYAHTDAGLLLLGISIAGLINSFDLGLSLGLINHLSQASPETGHSPWRRYVAATACTCLVEALVGVVAVIAWQWLGAGDLAPAVPVTVILFAVSAQALLLSASGLKGQFRFKEANLVSTGSALAVYGVGTAMAALRTDIWHMFYAMTAAQLVAAVLSIRYCWKVMDKDIQAGQPHAGLLAIYRELLVSSLHFFPQTFAGIVFMHAQRLAIARIVGVESVALLSFAYSVASRAHAVVNAFLEVLFPMAKTISASTASLSRFCIGTGMMALVVYAGVMACALLVVQHFAAAATWYLFLYAIGVSFSVAAAPAFHILNGNGKSARVSSYSLAGPVIFIATLSTGSLLVKVSSDLVPMAYALAMLSVLGLTWCGLRGIAPAVSPQNS